MPPDAPGKYFTARLDGGDVAAISSPMGDVPPRRRGTRTSGSTTPTRRPPRCARAGGTRAHEPFDVMEAGRMAVFADREGARFCVWQARGTAARRSSTSPAAELQRPEHARPRAAEEFYGAVFGWEPSTRRPGADVGAARLRRLPRGAHARVCARTSRRWARPTRFEEVVAAADADPRRQPETPVHWGVTFAVDDADAIAARATELGGTVVLPPVDGPWTRMTSSPTRRARRSRPASSCRRTRTWRRTRPRRLAVGGRAPIRSAQPGGADSDPAVDLRPPGCATGRAPRPRPRQRHQPPRPSAPGTATRASRCGRRTGRARQLSRAPRPPRCGPRRRHAD